MAETYDGSLDDINGFHVRAEHAMEALDVAKPGPVVEGNRGGGTGMVCNQFKGGIGTSSRRVGNYTVGVLVQCNYGGRTGLRIAGVPVGKEIGDLMPEYGGIEAELSTDTDVALSGAHPIAAFSCTQEGFGSIIVIVATDAPFLSSVEAAGPTGSQSGSADMGGYGSNGSGDIFLAFSTANEGAWDRRKSTTAEMLPNDRMSPFLLATAEATEEAIVNAMVPPKPW